MISLSKTKRALLCILIATAICYTPSSKAEESSFSLIQTSELSVKGTYDVGLPLDGLTILLKNGTQIRLAQIDIPDHFRPEPGQISSLAKEKLIEVLENGKVKIFHPSNPKFQVKNRLNQEISHIQNNEGLWLQKELISNGLARVIPSPYLPQATTALLDFEQEAREKSLGLWEDPRYTLQTPLSVKESAWEMQIIVGEVKKIATVKNNAYLNFGVNYKTDFTIQIDNALRREFSKSNIDIFKLQNKKVEVRGYVESFNGPLVKLESTAHLRVIE